MGNNRIGMKMTIDEHQDFLLRIEKYVEEHPEVVPYISDYVSRGLRVALNIIQEKALDMECALVGALELKGANGKALLYKKLKKWNGRSHVDWSPTIARMEGRNEARKYK